MKLKTPKGAVDTHMHFYDGASSAKPGAPNPGTFTVPMYRELQKRLGLERVVVVQPNAYRDDNTVTLKAMKELGKSAKGVAVVMPGTPKAELERLTKAGICAVRIMTLHNGTLGFDVMDQLMKEVHPFGWHANIQLDGRQLPDYEAQIKRLPGKFVIDHIGKFLEPVPPDHPGFRSLLRLVDTGRFWVKLSGAYMMSKSGPPLYSDMGTLAKALVKHAPGRLVWASNWPHPMSRGGTMPEDAVLLDLLLDWAPEEKTRNRILASNPAELYGFK